mmetsp:Transcript_5433/g.10640  ORF Transcript_5433/g.10640 Transcript_5433/m.10640 type:complete len:158 (-) Transcript_5433:778-1251(-)
MQHVHVGCYSLAPSPFCLSLTIRRQLESMNRREREKSSERIAQSTVPNSLPTCLAEACLKRCRTLEPNRNRSLHNARFDRKDGGRPRGACEDKTMTKTRGMRVMMMKRMKGGEVCVRVLWVRFCVSLWVLGVRDASYGRLCCSGDHMHAGDNDQAAT